MRLASPFSSRPTGPSLRWGRGTVARWAASIGSFAVLSTMLVGLAPTATAADDANDMHITKTVSKAVVAPLEVFTYTLSFDCYSNTSSCIDATVVDTIPAPLEIVGIGVLDQSSTPGSVSTGPDGRTITLAFTKDFGTEGKGLAEGAAGSLGIQVRFPARALADGDLTLTNIATMTASNRATKTSDVDATVNVTPQVGALAEKTWSVSGASPSGAGSPDEIIEAGAAKSVTLGFSTTSNIPVQSLLVQEPSIPSAAPAAGTTFDSFDLVGIGAVVWPAGATGVTVTTYGPGGTTASLTSAKPAIVLPAGLAADQVTGMSFDFTGTDITPGSGSVVLDLAQRATLRSTPATAVTAGTVSNKISVTATGDVNAAPVSSTPATAESSFKLIAAQLATTATKSAFSPASIPLTGTHATVTIKGTNASNIPVNQIQLADPAVGGEGFFGPSGLAFNGFGTNGDGGAGISWPAGATEATVTVLYNDGTSGSAAVTTTNTLPAAAADFTGGLGKTWADIAGFTVSFTGPAGSIAVGQSASVPYQVLPRPGAQVTDVVHPAMKNCVAATVALVDGLGATTLESAPDIKCSALTLVEPTVGVDVAKRLTSSSILTTPGSTTTAVLTATSKVGTATGSGNTKPTRLVIEDSSFQSAGNARWWEVFSPVALVGTPVAAGDTLSIEYTTSASAPGEAGWTSVATIPGSTLVSQDLSTIPAGATGVRLVFTRPTGFPDGQTVQANVTFAVRTGLLVGTFGDGTTVTNCAVAQAGLAGFPSVTASATTTTCPSVTGVDPASGPGSAPLVKSVTGTVTEGASGTVPVTIGWSTLGVDNYSSVTIADRSDAAGTPVLGKDSFWDVFDVVSVNAITSGPAAAGAAYDPYLAFDKVTAVEIYDTTTSTWRSITNSPCPSGCVGQFPGVTLTNADRAVAGAVRLVYEPQSLAQREAVVAAMVAAGDWRVAIAPTAAQAGVAVSPAADHSRTISMTARLRDTLRASGEPVNDARYYNAGACAALPTPADPANPLDCRSKVVNDAIALGTVGGATATIGSGGVGNPVADRTVSILPMTLAVKATKTWMRADAFGQSPRDLGVPAAGTAQADYPRANVITTVRNTTGGSAVDSLTVTEPQLPALPAGGRATDPFSVFTITSLATTAPVGATATAVYLNTGSGFSATPATLPISEATLADVIQVKVVFTGRIATNALGTVTLGTQLRETNRVDGSAPTENTTITNTVGVEAADSRVCEPASTGLKLEDPYSSAAQAQGGCVLAPVRDAEDDKLTLSARSLDVAVTKAVNPGTINRDTSAGTPVTATLGVQNVGNSEADTLTLEDSSPTFFNTVAVTGVKLLSYPGGADAVRLDVRTGATFTADDADLTATGGTWTTGTASPVSVNGDIALPSGLAWADVTGVRVVFTGQGLLASPGAIGTVAVKGTLLPELRSGDVVPSASGGVPATFSDTVANPGETVVGQVSNTVTGRADRADALPSVPRTASDDFSVRAGTIAVSVKKTPTGDQKPGEIVDFKLTFVNSGTADIIDPVVTDFLPVDSKGPLLTVDTLETGLAAGTGERPWSVDATAAADPALQSPGALRYNSTAAEETIDGVDVPAHAVRVTWPAGTILQPGERVVVTLPMLVRSSALGSVTNTFALGTTSTTRTITAAQCFGLDGAASTFVASDSSCRTPATINIIESGAFTSRKDVRAWPADLGAINAVTNNPADVCIADADGFVAYPCVAHVAPGGQMRWRTSARAGNVDTASLVLVDVLPHAGDVGELTNIPRGTQWHPTWDGVTPTLDPTFANAAGSTLTVLYSTAADPAIDYTDAAGGDWSAIPPADPTTVTGFKFVLTFPGSPGAKLLAGDAVRVAWTMLAPYSLAGDGWQGYDAWNTFGYTALFDKADPSKTYVSQPRKAGVRLPHGEVTVTKTVVDDTAFNIAAGQSFEAQILCTVPTDPTSPSGPRTAVTLHGNGLVTLDAANAFTTVVTDVPIGSECSVEETNSGSASLVTYAPVSSDPAATTSGTISVAPGSTAAQNTLAITNTYEAAGLTVSKVLADDAELPAGTTFPFTVTCTVQGSPLALDPADASFTLAGGESRTISGLPVGAVCDVLETSSGDALASYQVGQDAPTDTPAQVTVDRDSTLNAVTVTNTFVNLSITKSHTGDQFAVGDEVTFLLEVTNHGPRAASDVVVSDPVPAGLTKVRATGLTGSWDACVVGTPGVAGTSVSCALVGDLAAGETVQVEVRGVLVEAAYPSVVNTATVTTPTQESTLVDNTDSDTVTLKPRPSTPLPNTGGVSPKAETQPATDVLPWTGVGGIAALTAAAVLLLGLGGVLVTRRRRSQTTR